MSAAGIHLKPSDRRISIDAGKPGSPAQPQVARASHSRVARPSRRSKRGRFLERTTGVADVVCGLHRNLLSGWRIGATVRVRGVRCMTATQRVADMQSKIDKNLVNFAAAHNFWRRNGRPARVLPIWRPHLRRRSTPALARRRRFAAHEAFVRVAARAGRSSAERRDARPVGRPSLGAAPDRDAGEPLTARDDVAAGAWGFGRAATLRRGDTRPRVPSGAERGAVGWQRRHGRARLGGARAHGPRGLAARVGAAANTDLRVLGGGRRRGRPRRPAGDAGPEGSRTPSPLFPCRISARAQQTTRSRSACIKRSSTSSRRSAILR